MPLLPWPAATTHPLMLAPMQGLTNRALRAWVIELARPDVVFTEFVRVPAKAKKGISAVDRLEVTAASGGVPLVVQLIGADPQALVLAAQVVQELGGQHLNINLGCPYGRMSTNSAGGALLRDPVSLAATLTLLRRAIAGGLSVKLRSGYDNPRQIFALLPVFADCGVDFLILHPRTVVQKYGGSADHELTREVVAASNLPVIANGDIFSASRGRELLARSQAAGLMMGRGAISDPLIFQRLRGLLPDTPDLNQRRRELHHFLFGLVERYQQLFSGEQQVLRKLKEVLSQNQDEELKTAIRPLLRAKGMDNFCVGLNQLRERG